jgi:hypothetical protein
MTERIFKYVPHSLREAYESLGWIISELGPPHCDYSVLAEWIGDGEPLFPAPHTDSGREA